MLKRSLKIFAALVALLAVCAYSYLQLSVASPGDFEVAGIAEEIEIRFDAQLRPFADATSLEDALFAEGWLHARYRTWQMELLRRAGKGRLADGLGASLLESDIALWRAGVPQLAARLEADTADFSAIDAYIAGVNAGLDSLPARPPDLLLTGIDPEPWTRYDVFAVAAIIAFQTANNMDRELLRLSLANLLDDAHLSVFLPDESTRPGFPYVLRDPQLMTARRFTDALDAFETRLLPNAAFGSSGWVVSPSRSASGNVLFAFDSHDALNLPNLFYEVHLFYGTGKSIRGWSTPGLPGVINGYNENIAWGLTNIGDTQDLFVEIPHPEKPNHFLSDGEWYEAQVESVSIPVKGQGEAEVIEIVTTANGPLIETEPPISLRWTGHDPDGRGIDALLGMNTASNWEEFEDAINRHAAPSLNVTYGDRDQRIAFRTIGLLPVRGAGNGLLPLDGSVSANGWQGYVPDKELPSILDPQYGYVAAANARVHDGLPLVSADNAPGYRLRRLHDLLSSRGGMTIDDMADMQLDTFNVQAALLLPTMLPPREARFGAPYDLAVDVLRGWADEPFTHADSAGALIWEQWYQVLARRVLAPLDAEMRKRVLRDGYLLNHALDRLLLEAPGSPWWQGDRGALVRESLFEAIDLLAETHGVDPLEWRWDAAHSVSFRHELHGAVPMLDGWLSRGPYPWQGGNATLARARYSYARPFEGRAGATVRVVAEMSGPMEVHAVIPGGQHGHPSSDYYDDQLRAWLEGAQYNLKHEPKDVFGDVTTLTPAK